MNRRSLLKLFGLAVATGSVGVMSKACKEPEIVTTFHDEVLEAYAKPKKIVMPTPSGNGYITATDIRNSEKEMSKKMGEAMRKHYDETIMKSFMKANNV